MTLLSPSLHLYKCSLFHKHSLPPSLSSFLAGGGRWKLPPPVVIDKVQAKRQFFFTDVERIEVMGQGLSCGMNPENDVFSSAVRSGETEIVKSLLQGDSNLLLHRTFFDRHSALHLAAVNGHSEIVSILLDWSMYPNILNRYKQTPLMLAAMHGRISCVERLLQAGADVLIFDSLNGRTCLHYAAFNGHYDCLQAILVAAHSSPAAISWGFSRFVNVRDVKGATPLHLAARRKWPNCVHLLLVNGALVSSSRGEYGFPGGTPLHMAARGGSLDCVRELLAWGADRRQRDETGRIPYVVALAHSHRACAAILDPRASEPLVWPSPLKFISELNQEAKVLLERALTEASKAKEKVVLRSTVYSLPSSSWDSDHVDDAISEDTSDAENEICCICFDQACTIEIQDCGHQMCAQCTLALCCHSKPNPKTLCLTAPLCPFCRNNIARLAVVKIKSRADGQCIATGDTNPVKLGESKGLSEAGPFRKLGVLE